MSRKLTAILVSGSLLLSMTTSAWAQTVSSPPLSNQQVQSTAANTTPSGPLTTGTQLASANTAKNQPPLAPGGAAGIEVAQGGGSPLWPWVVGALVAGAVLWWILSDDDDSGSSTSPSD